MQKTPPGPVTWWDGWKDELEISNLNITFKNGQQNLPESENGRMTGEDATKTPPGL